MDDDDGMQMQMQTLKPFELHYADLLLLSSDTSLDSLSSDLSVPELQRLVSVSNVILETLGPTGPGLLSIAGVPNSSSLRRKLLPHARKLALLKHDDRKRILKEHRLGSDVPLKNLDRDVSSFAMKLEYVQGKDSKENKSGCDLNAKLGKDFTGERGDGFEDLGDVFALLGQIMIDLGIRLARVCDRVIGGRELEQSLLESSTAKGRLIHYHSVLDNLIIREKEAGKKKLNIKSRTDRGNKMESCISVGVNPDKYFQLSTCQSEDVQMAGGSNLWQKWHYDYGIFTILTDPLFISSCSAGQSLEAGNGIFPSDEHEIESPTGHTCLQVLDTYSDKLVSVKASPESFIIQVGESADILSKGRLRATLHSVSRQRVFENVSRETLVVFLQPAWSKIFTLENYSTQQFTASNDNQETNIDDDTCRLPTRIKLIDDIQRTIPPLSFRLKDGMTFAEFSKETTKQYYGESGLQSNK